MRGSPKRSSPARARGRRRRRRRGRHPRRASDPRRHRLPPRPQQHLLSRGRRADDRRLSLCLRMAPALGGPPKLVARQALNAYYDASSFRWFAWYLGGLTLAFAVIGFIVLGMRAVRSDSPAFVLLAAAMPVTTFYIASEHLTRSPLGDAAVSPGRAAGDDDCRGRGRDLVDGGDRRVAAATTRAVRRHRRGRDARTGCHRGSRSSARRHRGAPSTRSTSSAPRPELTQQSRLSRTDSSRAELPQTLRSFCGVPTAGLDIEPRDRARRLRPRVEGRRTSALRRLGRATPGSRRGIQCNPGRARRCRRRARAGARLGPTTARLRTPAGRSVAVPGRPQLIEVRSPGWFPKRRSLKISYPPTRATVPLGRCE